MTTEQTPLPARDPIIHGSLSWPLAISSLLLLAATAWTFYDEFYGSRPYVTYQSRFSQVFPAYLDEIASTQEGYREKVAKTSAYQRLAKEKEKLDRRVQGKVDEIDLAIEQEINPALAAITPAMQDARGQVSALIYQLEEADHRGDEEEKDAIAGRIARIKKGPFVVRLPAGEGRAEETEFDYDSLIAEFDRLKGRRDELTRERARLKAPANEVEQEMHAYLAKHLAGLTPEQIAPLKAPWEGFLWPIDAQIRQIHVGDVGLIDRCESCHLAIRSPLVIRAEDMEGERAFTSHPRRELLEIHDPDSFGCSPCHGGNGIATTSVEEAHGREKHWLWPLHAPENAEAGCLQCHEGALRLEHATTFNEGAELFRHLGCWGCHPRANYDRTGEEKKVVRQQLEAANRERFEIEKEIQHLRSGKGKPGEQARADLVRVEALSLGITEVETRRILLEERQTDLAVEDKEIGPNLKLIRAKLKPGFLPYWIGNTTEFRPTTRMPQFRASDSQIEAMAAYLWQKAPDVQAKDYERGDPEAGKVLFETRGCMGCHGLPDAKGRIVGSTFAVELSKIGEKADYGYVVGWILSPATSGDVGIPSHTVMPDLRLTVDEARHVATYLFELTKEEKRHAFDELPEFMTDPVRAAEGKDLIAHFGCFACHEIPGFEEAAKIGTELTKEGSKPIERLDFGLFTTEAKRTGWYDHKGFFAHKLADPAFFDQGKHKPDWREKLKMPEFNIAEKEIDALSTFLLGSVDSRLPERMYHDPVGPERDIRDGWWIAKKYNCVGCHQFVPGEKPPIRDLDVYAGENAVYAPPNLFGEGARVRSEWLIRFLKQPDLENPGDNGVRPYLAIRMPTFELSDEEISKLVRFFNALSNQPVPYLDRELRPLDERELAYARIGFVRGECLKCHVTDIRKMTKETVAPSFLFAAHRLKPQWTARWIVKPSDFAPGTKMPDGLFVRKEGRWVLAKEAADLADYEGDHVELFLRYIRFFKEDEAEKIEKLKAELGG